MESPPRKLIVGQDRADRISALTDHLLLDILERLDLREAVRAGALSTRWRRLPKHLSRVHLDVAQFQSATPLEAMDAFTGAARALLNVVPPVEGQCERGSLKVLILSFYISSPHLSSIGRLVVDIVSLGQTECFEFCVLPPPSSNTIPLLAEIGQQFMSFSRAYPVAFWWLTRLTLKKLVLGHSDITDLISACSRLRHLYLSFCRLVDPHSAPKIDVPRSGIQELEFSFVGCTGIELISVPKLRQVVCQNWLFENPPVCFGYVPELRVVQLFSKAKAWQVPFVLSECLSRSATNLSILSLDFAHQMLCRHSCVKTPENCAEKTNVVWKPSKDLKHLNLKLLLIFGCEGEDIVTSYISLVMERAVGLKRIELCGEYPCKDCNVIELERSKDCKASRHRVKERLTHGSFSSVEIIIR